MKKKMKMLVAMLMVAGVMFSVPMGVSAEDMNKSEATNVENEEKEKSEELLLEGDEDKLEEPIMNSDREAANKPETKSNTVKKADKGIRATDPTFSETFADQALAGAIAINVGKTKDEPMTSQDITNLFIVIISENQGIKSLDGIEKLTKTGFLYIDKNPINVIPDNIKDLPLEGLSMDECGINSIPSFLGEISTLKYLHLRDNNIASIPDSFKKHPNLKELILDGNGLSSIPKNIKHLPELDFLSLENNNITEIPEDFTSSTFPQMTFFDLSRNKISKVPDFTGPINYTLNLDCNRLREKVPTDIDTWTSGQTVNYDAALYSKKNEKEILKFDESTLIKWMSPIIEQYKDTYGNFDKCSWIIKQPDGNTIMIPANTPNTMNKISEALSVSYGDYSLTLHTQIPEPRALDSSFLLCSCYTVPITIAKEEPKPDKPKLAEKDKENNGKTIETKVTNNVKPKVVKTGTETSTVLVIVIGGLSLAIILLSGRRLFVRSK